jgi:hypothetical protein
MIGQRGEWFNIRTFWAWIINGFYHSAIGYVASIYFFINDGIQSNGQTSGHWVWGTTLYTAMLITVLGKAALITKYLPYSVLLLRRLTRKFVDKVDDICHSGIVCGVYDLSPDLCYRRATVGLFNGIRWNITAFIPHDTVLGFDRCYPHHVSHP